jgi:putative flavoprotein involved in K+ transport
MRSFGRVAASLRGPSPLPPPPSRPSCPRVPIIGLALADALRAGRIALRREPTAFADDTVRFADGREERFDAVILATGFRAAMGLLGAAVTRDACGFARRLDLVTSADRPGLFFVGHNYGLRGGLLNISRDGPLAARQVARHLAAT